MSDSHCIEQLAINTIRTLSIDAVEKAKSGHPGTPMALAPVAYTLFNDVLRFDPASPRWPGRDRFILSCGHASALLYSVLHLAGVKKVDAAGRVLDEPAISLEDLKRFRQLHSPTAGHPEYGQAAGIETTTGPLGQGVANSVGMAIAAGWLAARYNRPGFDLFGFNTYALCSDGDMMEGVGSEAASLAGHLKLSNVCWIYDDNHITIEGDTRLAFSEDVAGRFEALGWNVVRVADANDTDALRSAFQTFLPTNDRPTLIIVRSVIAWGAPHAAGTAGAHGAPLGEEEVRLAKEAYGWPADEHFRVPPEVPAHFAQGVGARGAAARRRWEAKLAEYESAHPEAAAEWRMLQQGRLPDGWDKEIPRFDGDAQGMATRIAGGKALGAVASAVPWLLGGSADLAPSTKTLLSFDGAGHYSAENRSGRNLHFGVREHAMGGIANGLALAGLRPYTATFFVFTDYMRPSMRLAALMGLPVIYIFTHDSIGVGEDGPTHQPVEQLAAVRAIPGLVVLRPGDANEAAEAYRAVMQLRDRPAALVLTRQNLPTLDRSKFASAAGVARGAYVLSDPDDGDPVVILIGTGSELSLCIAAQELLAADGIAARIVSMPSWELFEDQDPGYRDRVLPPQITARVAVEAGIEQGWRRYLGRPGRFVGMRTFGASAPAGQLMEHFGFTAENVAAQAKAVLGA